MSKPIDNLHSGFQPEKTMFSDMGKNIAIGSISSVSALGFIKPFMYAKSEAQAGSRQLKFNPRVWYRGIGGLAGSFIPSVTFQTVANEFLFKYLENRIASASVAGGLSAAIVCPSESILRQQEMSGKTFKQAASYIYSKNGLRGMFRGFIPTILREGIFTAGYLGVSPVLKEKFQNLGCRDVPSQIISGVTAGVGAAVLSHPFDTYKTKMQSDLSMQGAMLKNIFTKKAFKGLQYRMAMVTSAITTISIMQQMLKEKWSD